MSIKSQKSQLIILVESMNWSLIKRFVSMAANKEYLDSDVAIEKEYMISRIQLMTSANIPLIPCRYWVLQLQNFTNAKNLSKQKVLIHFSPIQQQVLFDHENRLVSPINTPYDPEFNFLRDLLYQETEKENYEKCSLIKKHLDTLLAPGKPFTHTPNKN